ncbi:MAG: dephospho-CoA kinase [Sphingobacteriales bacterium]|nr:dephospho-CoA kinase [Sphingobacteriales bacterium]MBI3718454.1 dephospho-CoA kinase [Sphingobacteriales bacterium]
MLQIGLTGGIGSGKSTVAKVFETLGIPVYYADEAGKKLMNEDVELKEQVINHFGADSYADGKLNRSFLASVVFNNKQKLELLNSLVHPATIKDAKEWMQKQTAPYSIKEAALIFESGSGAGLNYIIGVYAPQPLRIKRTIDRDHVTREEVIKRMQNQVNEEMKMKLCDFIIYNDEQQLVIPQVLKLHEQFLKEATSQ